MTSTPQFFSLQTQRPDTFVAISEVINHVILVLLRCSHNANIGTPRHLDSNKLLPYATPPLTTPPQRIWPQHCQTAPKLESPCLVTARIQGKAVASWTFRSPRGHHLAPKGSAACCFPSTTSRSPAVWRRCSTIRGGSVGLFYPL